MRRVGMRLSTLVIGFIGWALACGWSVQAAQAATCESGNFDKWVQSFRQEAAAKGISARGLAALDGVTYNADVIARDRKQGVFKQTFEQFSGRMVPPRMTRGSNMLKRYGSLLSRIEDKFGVQGPVLVAIWGLETDFGAVLGNFGTIGALASLAYDCRRSERFQAELLDAMR